MFPNLSYLCKVTLKILGLGRQAPPPPDRSDHCSKLYHSEPGERKTEPVVVVGEEIRQNKYEI